MKLKQLQALREQHSRNLQRKEVEEPNIGKAISLAIISGQKISLREPSAILADARKEIAECRCYGSSEKTLKFSQIFEFQSKELAEYKKASEAREKMLKTYSRSAEHILRKAEMDENCDPTEASEALAQAAHDAGLLS